MASHIKVSHDVGINSSCAWTEHHRAESDANSDNTPLNDEESWAPGTGKAARALRHYTGDVETSDM